MVKQREKAHHSKLSRGAETHTAPKDARPAPRHKTPLPEAFAFSWNTGEIFGIFSTRQTQFWRWWFRDRIYFL